MQERESSDYLQVKAAWQRPESRERRLSRAHLTPAPHHILLPSTGIPSRDSGKHFSPSTQMTLVGFSVKTKQNKTKNNQLLGKLQGGKLTHSPGPPGSSGY